jgi:hypothetical protein
MNDGRLKNPKLTSMVEEEKTYKDDNDENCNTICEICEKIYYPGEFWIACDTCDKWFHGKCVKISKAKSKKIGLYKCPLCNRKNNVHH